MFQCPQGNWSGVCEAIEEPKQRINKPCAKQVRCAENHLRFRVETDEGEKLVGKTFCADLSNGSELHSYLDSWLDGDFDRFLDEDGNVDLDLLVGRGADLIITHGPKANEHSYPFVKIAGIIPAGRLTAD